MKIRAENIPDELFRGKKWVCWNWEKRNEIWTKPLYNPRTGKYAHSDKPSTWATFAEAWLQYESRNYDGVGFVLSNADGFCGIDYDKVRDPQTGDVQGDALARIRAINSYTEISPSGCGLKTIVRAKLPDRDRQSAHYSFYTNKRYFTITGHIFDGISRSIEHRQEEVSELYNELFPRKEKVSEKSETQTTHNIDDSEIIEKALNANDGGKFSQLWEGDWSEYPSQSEADLALCTKLVFWVGADPQRINALFCESGLYRDKWDRDDYRDRTINAAIDCSTDTYNPAMDDHPAFLDEELSVESTEKPYLEVVDTAMEPQPEDSLEFPHWIMDGIAGDFAELYSSYLEVPSHFFYMGFLSCLGALIADRVTIASEIAPQPRLYTLLLGESADDRKSTAVDKVAGFFSWSIDRFPCTWGVNSAAGLQKYLEETTNLIILLDEFKQFVSKCKREGSVLLPAVGTLYESNRYEARTKKEHIRIDNAYLSILAASTADTYENTWDSSFTDIGFANRLWIVPGTGKRKHALPTKIPDNEKYLLKQRLGEILRSVGETEFEITPEAFKLYDSWYLNREKSVHSRRLGGYATRFMSLICVSEQKPAVDTETVNKVVALADWQLKARQLHDPIDAEGKVAKLEEKIRRQLKNKGPLTEFQLKRAVNYNRYGTWAWVNATRNMKGQKEIHYDRKKSRWSLLQPY
jgi:hypothetical protein